MAIRPVLRMGHPILMQRSKPVEQFNTPELNALITDMFDTMASLDGAGLAAPQIGVSLQVVIFGFDDNDRYPDAESVPKTILVNPKITDLTDELEGGWEGCLSIPDMMGYVKRPKAIAYQGYDEKGQEIYREVTGFHARVVQHECDHLAGILYPQRIDDLRLFGFSEELMHSDEQSD